MEKLLTQLNSKHSVPAKWLTEYNTGMIKFYETGDHAEMMSFLKKCHETMCGRFN
ncbi:hypothetical protein [Maridesulfovibrio frigidus]